MEKSTSKSHLVKGVIIATVLILLNFFVRRRGGIALPTILQFLPTVLLIVGISLSCLLFGRQANGTLAFGDIFAHGFKTTAVVTFLVAIYTFIMAKFVFPLTAREIEDAVKSLQAQGNMMEQEARRMAESSAKKAWIIEVSGAIFATLVTGLVGALIGAAFAKKKP